MGRHRYGQEIMTIEDLKTIGYGAALVCGGCEIELAAYAAWHWFGG